MPNPFLTTKFWVNWPVSLPLHCYSVVQVYWQRFRISTFSDLTASLKIATMLSSFCNSISPLWQLNGLRRGSLTAPCIRQQKVCMDLKEVLCHVGAATPALILGNLRVKTSVTSTPLPARVKKMECLSSYPNTLETHQAGLSIFRSLRMRVQIFFYTILECITSPPACPVIHGYSRSPLLSSCKSEGFLEVQHIG